MKLFVFMTFCAFSVAALSSTETDQLASQLKASNQQIDLKEVEKLLQQIESQEQTNKVKPGQEDQNVSESLSKLFSTFRQMTGAYVNVLNSVNKSLGLPKYPTLPGLQFRSVRQSDDEVPLAIKHIQQNLNKLQSSAVDVGIQITEATASMGEGARKTILDQFRGFTELWSKQLSEISQMLQTSQYFRQDQQRSIWQQINHYIQQVTKSIRDFGNNIASSIRNRVNGQVPPSG